MFDLLQFPQLSWIFQRNKEEIKKVASNKGLHYIHAVATGCYSLGLLLKFEVNEHSSINLP